MRIGIDFTAGSQLAGIGRYTRSLVSALIAQSPNDEIVLLEPRQTATPVRMLIRAPNVVRNELPLSERMLTRIWHRLRLPLYADVLMGGLDVFYAPDFVLPPLRRAPGVLTVHDLSYRFSPESFPDSLRSYLDAVVPRSIARARMILADSAATGKDLSSAYGVDPSRIDVLYCGVDPEFQEQYPQEERNATLRRYGVTFPYFLSVGTIQPRKNIARIIAAMKIVVGAGLPHHLVHVGRPGWLHEPIYAAPEKYDVIGRVHFLSDVAADEDLAVLYGGATALVFPSLYEGFGLPVLEAMACDTPVVTSHVSSLPEVAGDAAILVDPADDREIGTAMVNIAKDEGARARLVAAGRERVAEFSWERAAGELRVHLERAAQRGSTG